MYDAFYRLVLAHIDPERAHALARQSLTAFLRTRVGRRVLIRSRPDPVLHTAVFGLEFASPLGVAAGVDKDGEWWQELIALGFGFVEVGTVTARAQPGNPRPRIVRIVAEAGLLNRMGFPNQGAATVARRVGRRSRPGVLGINVGKSKDAPLDQATADVRDAVRQLARVADYLVVNVSSPNTPGLRDLQAVDALGTLVDGVRAELDQLGLRVPLLVKIAPDLADEEIAAIGRLAAERGLDGIVAVNTTVDRTVLAEPGGVASFEGGGISGRPLKSRALHVLRLLRETVGTEIELVSVGGVEGAEDVWERLLAGASLVQVYTGFVLGGPLWVARTNRVLAEKVRASGASSVRDLARRTATSS